MVRRVGRARSWLLPAAVECRAAVPQLPQPLEMPLPAMLADGVGRRVALAAPRVPAIEPDWRLALADRPVQRRGRRVGADGDGPSPHRTPRGAGRRALAGGRELVPLKREQRLDRRLSGLGLSSQRFRRRRRQQRRRRRGRKGGHRQLHRHDDVHRWRRRRVGEWTGRVVGASPLWVRRWLAQDAVLFGAVGERIGGGHPLWLSGAGAERALQQRASLI
mmetsp:Transcript_27312/g.90784  ORF Transcript_27312/g.90784 Transcript_27312/m.90784 type:complete len:219 (-) Transcript_27312:229-885(-)